MSLSSSTMPRNQLVIYLKDQTISEPNSSRRKEDELRATHFLCRAHVAEFFLIFHASLLMNGKMDDCRKVLESVSICICLYM